MQIIPKEEWQSMPEQAQQEVYDFFLFVQQHYCSKTSATEQQETKAFSHHSANLIDEWKDDEEDAVWK